MESPQHYYYKRGKLLLSKENGKQIMLYGVVLFYSISAALRTEKLCKEENMRIKLVPIPRQLSSDCGVCLRFTRQDEQAIRRILDTDKIEIQGIHLI